MDLRGGAPSRIVWRDMPTRHDAPPYIAELPSHGVHFSGQATFLRVFKIGFLLGI